MGAETTTMAAPSLYAIWNFAPVAPSYLAASIVTSSNLPVTTYFEGSIETPVALGFDVDCPASPHPQHAACTSLGLYPARIYQGGNGKYSGTLTNRHASETTEWHCAMEHCGMSHGYTKSNTMKSSICTGLEQARCSMTITNAQKKVVTTTTLIEGCEAPKMRAALTITAGFEKAMPWHGGDANMMEGVNGKIENLALYLRNVTDGDLDTLKCPTGRKDLEAFVATMTAAAGASPATTGGNAVPAETGTPPKSAGVKARMSAGLIGVVLVACGVLSI